ncbi:Imm8 family immunity protein [Hymenobacter sp. HD11105]
MKAIVKGYDRSQVDDLSTYEADTPLVFSYSLTFSIGPVGKEGADYFTVIVASAGYLQSLYSDEAVSFLRHTILARDYNVQQVVALMEKYVNCLEADSWEKLANQLSQVAQWEFEDYQPAP